jgi:uncharacterized membrane protein
MSKKRSLQIILGIGLFGLAFSGYLSYHELFASTPPAQSCPTLGTPGTVLGYPACVYGFFMYLAVTAVAAAGLRGKRERTHRRPGRGVMAEPSTQGPTA